MVKAPSRGGVSKKLRVKPGQKFLLLNPPAGYQESLGTMPDGLEVTTRPSGRADVIQAFVTSMKELEDILPGLNALLNPNGILWMTYPKGASKLKKDDEINRDNIRNRAARMGWEAVAIFSVDDDWAALRLKAN